MADLSRVQHASQRYVQARNALLDALHLRRKSNGDPLAEFSEWLVAALVGIFEALLTEAVVVLPARNLAAIGTAMGKRHGNLESSLQFTRANYRWILDDPAAFKALGGRLYLRTDWVIQ